LTEAGGEGVFSDRNLSYIIEKQNSGDLSWIRPEFQWKSIVHCEDWPAFFHAVQQCVSTGAHINVSCRLDSGRSKPVPVLVSGKLIRDSSGSPSWIEGAIAPLPEPSGCSGCREAIFEGEKRAKEFCKNILTVLSHDIRSPLIGVIGMLQLLRKSGLTERQSEYASVASESCERILEFAKNLLDFARIDAGKDDLCLQEVNLPGVVDSIAGLHLEQAMRGSVFLDLETDPDFPAALLCDEAKVRQILSNLVSNAIKFTPSGTVRLSLTHARLPHEKVAVILEVSDTGIGFDLAKATFMFDQFAQMCQEESLRRLGAGLGLTIVKGLVELFGGAICVDSAVGEGSSFYVSFPATGVD
jgi:signal transduction histidine kinase